MKILAFEGPDYAGKTTLIEAIRKEFPVYSFREPGSTHFGEEIRSSLENNPDICANAQLCAFYASRFELVNALVTGQAGPSLDHGEDYEKRFVIFDRFEASSYAYQVVEKGADKSLFSELSSQISADIEIYYVSIIMSYDTYVKRHKERPECTALDRFLDEETFYKRQNAYLSYFNEGNTNAITIKADSPLEEKVQQVVEYIRTKVLYDKSEQTSS